MLAPTLALTQLSLRHADKLGFLAATPKPKPKGGSGSSGNNTIDAAGDVFKRGFKLVKMEDWQTLCLISFIVVALFHYWAYLIPGVGNGKDAMPGSGSNNRLPQFLTLAAAAGFSQALLQVPLLKGLAKSFDAWLKSLNGALDIGSNVLLGAIGAYILYRSAQKYMKGKGMAMPGGDKAERLSHAMQFAGLCTIASGITPIAHTVLNWAFNFVLVGLADLVILFTQWLGNLNVS